MTRLNTFGVLAVVAAACALVAACGGETAEDGARTAAPRGEVAELVSEEGCDPVLAEAMVRADDTLPYYCRMETFEELCGPGNLQRGADLLVELTGTDIFESGQQIFTLACARSEPRLGLIAACTQKFGLSEDACACGADGLFAAEDEDAATFYALMEASDAQQAEDRYPGAQNFGDAVNGRMGTLQDLRADFFERAQQCEGA